MHRHQHIAGLEIAMNDPFLVRVLHGPADGDEKLDAIVDGKQALVAKVGDGNSPDQFHDEVGTARLRWRRHQKPARCWDDP